MDADFCSKVASTSCITVIKFRVNNCIGFNIKQRIGSSSSKAKMNSTLFIWNNLPELLIRTSVWLGSKETKSVISSIAIKRVLG